MPAPMWILPSSMPAAAPANAGRPRKREIHLRDSPDGPEIPDLRQEVGVEVRRLDELQAGRLRIGVRDHGARVDHFPAGQLDAGRPPVANDDPPDFRIRPDFGPRRARRRDERHRERAHSSPRERRRRDRVPVERGLEQRPDARSRRPGAGKRAEDPPRRDRRAEQVGLEPLADEVRNRHRAPPQKAVRIPLSEAAEAASDTEKTPQF